MKTWQPPGLVGLAVLAIAAVGPRDARADSRAVAEALFRDGTQLLAEGQFDEACPKLAESQKLDPALGTLFYLAACHEKQGLTASAWSEFTSATEWAKRTNQSERVVFGRKHLVALEARLATVSIQATRVAGLELRVDDGLLSAAAVGTPLPLDPGAHVIEATAPGYDAWRTTVDVPAGLATLTVTVPALRAEAQAPARAPVEQPLPSAAPVRPGPHLLTWSAGSLAAAGIVVGSLFGALTFGARDRALTECPGNRCAPGGLEDIDHARTYATVSTVGFGVGLAAAAATAYLLIRGDIDGGRSPSAAVRSPPVVASPSVSTRGAAIALVARFE